MPSKVLDAYAAYYCCQTCWQNAVWRTAFTGYQISCDSSDYSIKAWSNCNLTAKDANAFTDCSDFNGATKVVVSPVYILSFLFAFFYLFQ